LFTFFSQVPSLSYRWNVPSSQTIHIITNYKVLIK
jgi:hypothetical protein